MKELIDKEFLEAPKKVQFIYIMAKIDQPIGSQIIEDAIKESPEYFPDELEHRRKWALIPQHVHDSYSKEIEILRTEIYKEMPESKGILGWINDPKGYEEYSIKWRECYERERPFLIALHKRFYGRYNIKIIDLDV
jgi:hypothetical protein